MKVYLQSKPSFSRGMMRRLVITFFSESLRKVHICLTQSRATMTSAGPGRICLLLAGFLLLCTPACPPSDASGVVSATLEWTEHDILRIDGDSNFTAANGVVSGSGTKADPYIIEGWKIGPHEGFMGMDIRNTRAYFRIRDVFVFNCSIAVLLNNVSDARVESSTFTANSIGVAAYHCDDCKVWNCTFEGNNMGISISYSDLSQSDNTFVNNGMNVFKLREDRPPWEQTWVGVAVCVAILVPLAIVSTLMLYYRYKYGGWRKPEE